MEGGVGGLDGLFAEFKSDSENMTVYIATPKIVIITLSSLFVSREIVLLAFTS